MSNGFYVFFSLALNIDENIIKVYDNKDIKLFYQNLVDIVLKYGWCIGPAKKHYLILEIAVMGLESHLLFIAFFDFHIMIRIG